MAIPGTGQISLNTIKNEFGDPNGDGQYKLSEYYRDGDNAPIPNSQTNIPASGPISITDFYNTNANPEVYYVRKGTSSTDITFDLAAQTVEEGYVASAVAQIAYKVIQSGTSIQIYAWDASSSGDGLDSVYYNTVPTSVDFTSYDSNSGSLLIYSVAVGVTSGYSAYYTMTTISGSASTQTGASTLTASTTSSSGVAVTSSGQGIAPRINAVAPENDSDSDAGTGRITWTFTHSSQPTYTAEFIHILDAQAESVENDCPQCCIHDTMLVHTPIGEMHIDTLTVGSEVYSYDFETNKKVTDTITNIKRVKRDNDYKINDLILTADHPVYLEGGRLASIDPEQTLAVYKQNVDKIVTGDKMMTDKGLQEIITIDAVDGEQSNYTIHTSNNNFYGSPQGKEAILVDSVEQQV